jgi:hypothetical protein
MTSILDRKENLDIVTHREEYHMKTDTEGSQPCEGRGRLEG